MFKKITVLIMQGLLALLPISLTFYFLVWLVTAIESSLTPFIPEEFYYPGLGLFLGLIILLFVGLAVNAYIVKSFIRLGGELLEKIPVVKTIYGAIQDAVNLININKQQKMKSVVSVKINDSIHLIGFVTSHESAKELFNNDNKLGVYIPLSYQIGGYTLYIDKSQLTPLDISVETAMRIALTGGSVSTSHKKDS
ncbi:DUF502 domain-containing protein [Thalassotalea sp. 1_MG-2023]|uniref:DUF502 domain-containing protein n=1 Tax=Thalassotalea sp. 1_MG-2023 TaxID=3062680 RepID=UPI0026E24396|nr:DUF502 domain-containing protein [Thalassotalea sp. 1_MG-2023]MDO6427697.1 DUF502 domain-containing protein [Thalassotalea sp. 1_MG-2023]